MLVEMEKGCGIVEEKAVDYFVGTSHNCAMSVLNAVCDEQGIALEKQTMQVMRGFGGGMAAKHVCGALTGAIAALSLCIVEDPSQRYPAYNARAQWLIERFERELGSGMCGDLLSRYAGDDVPCARIVALAAKLVCEALELPEDYVYEG